jgi:L-cysteine desulfidase
VIEYARELGKTKEELYRALCISNLTAQDQKQYIGPLSAYCGVVCAAASAGAAITYLYGGTVEQIEHTVVNTIANVGGMICDGAKASCAAKVSSALQAAILGHQMAMQGITFEAGEGLVQSEPEETIRAIGYMGKEGMKTTDVEILNIMIGNRTI